MDGSTQRAIINTIQAQPRQSFAQQRANPFLSEPVLLITVAPSTAEMKDFPLSLAGQLIKVKLDLINKNFLQNKSPFCLFFQSVTCLLSPETDENAKLFGFWRYENDDHVMKEKSCCWCICMNKRFSPRKCEGATRNTA